MIATDRFVFLHLHKTGGTFVNECLLRFVPGATAVGYHLPRRMIPAASAHLPVLGLVRNPWSYYLSWYTFQRERPRPNPLFRILSDDGRLEFEQTIFRMLRLGEDHALLDQIVAALPAGYGGRGLNLPGPALDEIRGTGRGFYSFLYRYLYGGGASALHIGRMENLRVELLKMLEAVGQEVSEEMRGFVLHERERNRSNHAAYPAYYSEALQREVAERDAELITLHGYEFGA